MRWFDELYFWADGFEPTPLQWSRIQLLAMDQALAMLAREESEQVGVTLSHGTVQKFDEHIDRKLRAHALVAHRLVVLLRGSIELARSPYRIRAFADHLRSQQIAVGMRVSAPRMAMEMGAFSLVEPQFAKVLAPASDRNEVWHNMAVEARVAGVAEQWLIVAGLQTPGQVTQARAMGAGFGQGTAVRAPQAPEPRVSGRS